MNRKWIAFLAIVLSLSACRRTPEAAHSAADVANGNRGHRISFVPPRPVVEEDVRVTVSGAGEKVACQWRVNERTVEGITGLELPRSCFRKGDRVEVSVFSGDRVSQAETIIRNSPPKILSLPVTPAMFHRGIDLSVAPEAVDPDGDPVQFRFTWILNGEELPAETSETLPGDRFRRGDRVALAVTPYDSEGEGEAFRSGEVEVPNAPPVFVSPPPGDFKSEVFTYKARAEDPDGDPLTYSLAQGPKRMLVDSESGSVSWPITTEGFGKQMVKIVASDSRGGSASLEFTLDIALRE